MDAGDRQHRIDSVEQGDTATPEWLEPLRRRLARVQGGWVYGAVPTRVLPLAVRAALKVAVVFVFNFGPYSFFWPL